MRTNCHKIEGIQICQNILAINFCQSVGYIDLDQLLESISGERSEDNFNSVSKSLLSFTLANKLNTNLPMVTWIQLLQEAKGVSRSTSVHERLSQGVPTPMSLTVKRSDWVWHEQRETFVHTIIDQLSLVNESYSEVYIQRYGVHHPFIAVHEKQVI